MPTSTLTWVEIFFMQAYLGLPVFLAAVLVLALFLGKARRATLEQMFLVAASAYLMAWALAVLIWLRWPFHHGIMFHRYLNLPALIAAAVIFPLLAAIGAVAIRKKKFGRYS